MHTASMSPRVGLFQKGLDDVVEAVEIRRGELADDRGDGPLGVLPEEPQEGFGSPDIAGEKHG